MLTSNGSILLLDHRLSVSQAHIKPEVKRILTGVVKEAIVKVYHEHFYRVTFDPSVQPQVHIISYDMFCSCILGQDCPAVTAAKLYLQRGMGEPAKMPSPGFFPAIPHFCPICGARACYEPRLSSHHRGIGWQCTSHGISHYWQYQGTISRPTNPA